MTAQIVTLDGRASKLQKLPSSPSATVSFKTLGVLRNRHSSAKIQLQGSSNDLGHCVIQDAACLQSHVCQVSTVQCIPGCRSLKMMMPVTGREPWIGRQREASS